MKKLKATIVSIKMQKTAVVRVDSFKKHPKYHKYYRVSKKFKAHVEGGDYRAGDQIIIQETRPISKEKRWKIMRLVKRASDEGIAVEEISNV